MSKAHRGKGIKELFSHGRGECPVCQRINVKILYEQETGGQKIKICKTCKAAVKHGTKKLPVVAVQAEAPTAAETPAAEVPAADATAAVST